MGKVGRLVQAARLALRIGNYHVGVRSNNHLVIEQVASILASRVIEDPAAPANFSIYEPRQSLDGARPMYRVYEGCARIFLTPSLRRAAITTVGQLEKFLPDDPPAAGLLPLRVLALVDHEAAVLAPDRLQRRIPSLELQLRRRGIRMLSATPVLIDADRGDLLVRSLRLAPDGPTGAAGDPSVGRGSPDQPGRRRVVGWFFDIDGTALPALTRAQAVVRGLMAARMPGRDGDALELLARFIRGLDVREPPAPSIVASTGELLLSRRQG